MRNSETRTSKTAFRNSCFARACTSALRFPVMAGNRAKCNRKLRYNAIPRIAPEAEREIGDAHTLAGGLPSATGGLNGE
jgi:hypothetical protein